MPSKLNQTAQSDSRDVAYADATKRRHCALY